MSGTNLADRLAAVLDQLMRQYHACAVDRTEHLDGPAEECEGDGCRDVNLALAEYTRERAS